MGMIDAVKIMCDAELKAESNKITLGEYEAMIRPLRQVMTKADYENRLKADLKAILVELQLEIEETAKDAHINAFMNGYKDMYLNGISASAIKCSEIIQQKINSLKEGT